MELVFKLWLPESKGHAPSVSPQMSAHVLCLGLSSSKVGRSSGGLGLALLCALPFPAKPVSPVHQLQVACLLLARLGEPCSLCRANPQLPHSICFSPILYPTLPWGGEKGRKKELLQSPGSSYRPLLSFPKHALSPWPARFPSPTYRKLLTPSHNTQHHAHFHKYKANRVGQRGRPSVRCSSPHLPGAPFYPQHLVSLVHLRSPPALKIALPASPVPLATSFRIGYVVRSLEASRLGFPPRPPNSK